MPYRRGTLAVACVLLGCVVEAHAGVPRTELLLNGRWEVRAGDPDRGPLGPWQPVRVPEPIVPDPNRREATYRLRFPLPRDVPRGRDALLTFAMAGHHARVVLNGKVLGEHYGIRLPFSFDVTHVLRPGADNELVVVTHVADAAHARPGGVASAEEAKAYDIYWTGPPRGGTYPPAIVGDVTLAFVPAVRVEDVFVRTSVRDRTVVVAFEVANHGPAAAHVVARAEVVRLDGTPARVALPEGAVTVRPGRRLAVERSATFPDALPWPDGAPTPPLYVLRTTLTDGQRRVDAVTTRFGVREISTDGRALLLNGRPLRVVGTNTVAIMDRERLAHLFAALRMVGVNAVFLHWSDASDAFYDVADEAGMLVLAELYCSGPPFRWPSPAGRFWADDMRPQYEQWVKLRRNHPSIVLWSAYDMAPTPPLAAAVLDGFGALIRSLDPTRPILHRDVFAVSVGDLKAFVADPNARRVYDDALARSQMANRPLLVHEVVGLDALSATELDRFRAKLAADGVVGWGGLQIETALFRARAAEVSWPSLTGRDGRLPPEGGRAVDVVNWSDPGQPAFTVAELGDRLAGGPDRSDTVAPAVLRFQRSPELLVLVPAALGGRAFALATPVAGAGAIERGTLVDGAGTGWLVLTEPGTYRVQATDAGVAAKTVTAMPTDFDPAPGWAHVERVALTP